MALCLPAILFTRSADVLPELAMELIESTGILLIIAGVLGRFWSILYIGGHKNASIIQDGPYSICRHPLYLFSTIAAAGFGMMLGSLVLMTVLTGAVLIILSDIAAKEERFLRDRFGLAYDAYAAKVPRILPRGRGFSTPKQVTFDVHVLRRNLSDALVFLSLIPLGELMSYFKEEPLWPMIPIY
ncbi:Phospholipid methyltransferase [Jannaschia helgolandensis]|uniref:Phospholipid methyltransferase n=2 Tax=Jannaschia helgolandensis TaxID=188906 RepID=A0A1H7SC12_9RHOB|nr:Phospholipid methyltransferase [Jannaschia helgolandensis]